MREYDVRQALHKTALAVHRDEPDTLVIDELGLANGKAIVDVAVINGTLHGYEIKSARDTLDRLPAQIGVYNTTLDLVTLVVAEKHRRRAVAELPCWWGVQIVTQLAEGGLEFDDERLPLRNPSVDPLMIASLLWRQEALDVLKDLDEASGYSSKPRRELYRRLVQVCDLDTLRDEVRKKLKARGDWKAEKRQARDSDSSPTYATPEQLQANLEWLLSYKSPRRPD